MERVHGSPQRDNLLPNNDDQFYTVRTIAKLFFHYETGFHLRGHHDSFKTCALATPDLGAGEPGHVQKASPLLSAMPAMPAMPA